MTKEENRIYQKAYYQRVKADPQKEAARKKWTRENPEKALECYRRSKAKHKVARAAYNKQWQRLNKGKVSAWARIRQAKMIQAIPPWLTAEQLNDIKKFYQNRPDGHHVDHIVPLRGKNVCGLHVSWNLQYLPADENLKKSNKY